MSIHAQKTYSTLGQYLVLKEKMTQSEVDSVCQAQANSPLRFGALAVQKGFISAEVLQQSLAAQWGFELKVHSAKQVSAALHTLHTPDASSVDCLRGLRLHLQQLGIGSHEKGLVVAGVMPKCGTSELAANLAILFAKTGLKTLLIDANFANPQQASLFGLDADIETGMTQFLDSAKTQLPTLHSFFNQTNFFMMLANNSTLFDKDSLSNVSLAYFYSIWAKQFDVIIWDGCDLQNSVAADSLWQFCPATLLTVRKHKTPHAALKVAKAKLDAAKARCVGTVLYD